MKFRQLNDTTGWHREAALCFCQEIGTSLLLRWDRDGDKKYIIGDIRHALQDKTRFTFTYEADL